LSIETGPGSYALCLLIEQARQIRVGKAGVFYFWPGIYFYAGSAQGPGGVSARLNHHLRLAISPHWHLDWLRPYARIIQGYFVLAEERLGCRWSKALAHLPSSRIPVAGFGASDCQNGCPAHLISLANGIRLEQVRFVLQNLSVEEVRQLSYAKLAALDNDRK